MDSQTGPLMKNRQYRRVALSRKWYSICRTICRCSPKILVWLISKPRTSQVRGRRMNYLCQRNHRYLMKNHKDLAIVTLLMWQRHLIITDLSHQISNHWLLSKHWIHNLRARIEELPEHQFLTHWITWFHCLRWMPAHWLVGNGITQMVSKLKWMANYQLVIHTRLMPIIHLSQERIFISHPLYQKLISIWKDLRMQVFSRI